MDKRYLHELIDTMDDRQVEIVYKMILPVISETEPLPDEIKAIENNSNEEIVSYDAINW